MHQGDLAPPVQALRPEVPGAVAAIVAKLMAKHPDDRYQTAAEVAAALAPLSVYPSGSQPVAIRLRRGESPPAAETISASGRSTVPSDVSGSTDVNAEPLSPDPHASRSAAQKALHDAIDALTPSALLSEPLSLPYAPVVRVTPPGLSPPATSRGTPAWMWIAIGLGVAAAGVGLYLSSPGRPATETTVGPSAAASPEGPSYEEERADSS